MNSKNCLLLSHVWIDDNQKYKRDIIDLCVRHFLRNNENLYIILTGHGVSPYDETLSLCDHVDWRPEIVNGEIGKGHPKLVESGLLHAKDLGFERVLKQRADGIITHPNAHNFYDKMLTTNKMVAAGLQGPDTIGDLLMYGDLDVFLDGWCPHRWDNHLDGVKNFTKFISQENRELVIQRSAAEMGWVYLDPHWEEICSQGLQNDVINNNFEHNRFYWGVAYSERAQAFRGLGNNGGLNDR